MVKHALKEARAERDAAREELAEAQDQMDTAQAGATLDQSAAITIVIDVALKRRPHTRRQLKDAVTALEG